MRKLSRYSEHRISMLRNLARSLIQKGRIFTTVSRAKEARSFLEPMITRAKEENLSNRRVLLSRLNNENAIVNKLFKIGKANLERNGGYVRILRAGFRSDGGIKAMIQIIDYPREDGNGQKDS